jgi:hypothetical protein
MREVIRVVAVQNGIKKKYAVFHKQQKKAETLKAPLQN